ncbi:hypothetical protein DFH09DRAFT_1472251 [Mycena vulgaris]|nr:hypothetical protein DFH09DRAFT_1472251 [Mycena vulgaris]
MPPTRCPRFHGSAPPSMLEGNSMFSHASGFTINGGTFNINHQQPPPVILSPPNSPSWSGGPDWAGYIAHLEARLAALEAVVNLSPVDSHGSQRNQSMEDIPNPDNQPECGDHVRSTEFGSRDMDARDVVNVSGDCSGIPPQLQLQRLQFRLTPPRAFHIPEDMRDAGATGVERLQPGPAAVSSTSQAFMMPKPVEHRPEPSNVE